MSGTVLGATSDEKSNETQTSFLDAQVSEGTDTSIPDVSSNREDCYGNEKERSVNSVWDICDGFAEEMAFEGRIGP